VEGHWTITYRRIKRLENTQKKYSSETSMQRNKSTPNMKKGQKMKKPMVDAHIFFNLLYIPYILSLYSTN
jgi:hypothetical protein